MPAPERTAVAAPSTEPRPVEAPPPLRVATPAPVAYVRPAAPPPITVTPAPATPPRPEPPERTATVAPLTPERPRGTTPTPVVQQAPPECVPHVALELSEPGEYPWWPGGAQLCGIYGGQSYYRQAPGYEPPEPPGELPPPYEPGELELEAGGRSLAGRAMVDATYAAAGEWHVEPAAMLAVAMMEGANGGIGDSGTAYGPWQIHLEDGRVPAFKGRPRHDEQLNAWAWSVAGIRYAASHIAQAGAGFQVGHGAIRTIVYRYEKPADKAGEYAGAVARYDYATKTSPDARAYFAGFMRGVAGGGSPPPLPPPGPVLADDAKSGWRELMLAIGQTAPNRAGSIRAVGTRLRAAVR